MSRLPGKGDVKRMRKRGCPVGDYYFWWKRQRIFTGTRDKREARTFQAQFVAQQIRRNPSKRVSLVNATMSDLFEVVRSDYRRKGRRTADRLESRLKVLDREIGSIRVLHFDGADVEAFVDARLDENLKPASINRYLESVRRALNLGVQRRLLIDAPRIEMMPVANERKTDLTRDEYVRLIDVAREPVRLMTIIAYHIGWRAEPILYLRWQQVDFDAGVIYAPDQQPGKKVGSAPIWGDLRRALLEEKMRQELTCPECSWVCQRDGSRLQTYRKAFEDARNLIGRPDLHFHDLRGVAETNMVEAGLSEARARSIVGHRSTKMLDRYHRASIERLRADAEILEQYGRGEKILGSEPLRERVVN